MVERPKKPMTTEQDADSGPVFVLVGCGAAKRDLEADESVRARDLYTSTYFGLKARYAVRVASAAPACWRILSAKHRVLHPSTPVGHYDCHIDDLTDRPYPDSYTTPPSATDYPTASAADAWAEQVRRELTHWRDVSVRDDATPSLVVLLGQRYLNVLRAHEVFDRVDVRALFPFEAVGLGGIGHQMQWLSEQIDALDTGQQAWHETEGL